MHGHGLHCTLIQSMSLPTAVLHPADLSRDTGSSYLSSSQWPLRHVHKRSFSNSPYGQFGGMLSNLGSPGKAEASQGSGRESRSNVAALSLPGYAVLELLGRGASGEQEAPAAVRVQRAT